MLNAFQYEKITVEDLLNNIDRLAIPHFQRGIVWKSNAVIDLLDSLHKDYPCGTILLGEPECKSDMLQYGEGLVNKTIFDYYIIDGQQRIYSLMRCFDSSGSYLLDIESFINSDGNLFVCSSDIKKKDPKNYLKLRKHYTLDDLKSTIIEGEENKVFELNSFICNKILKRVLFLKVIKYTNYSDVILLYNKINSVGVRVDKEEKSYAQLVGINVISTTKHLYEIFNVIHDKESESRNDLLKREKERKFGFKLFIRTFILVYQVSTGRLNKSNYAAFDDLLKADVIKYLNSDSNYDKYWNLTKEILVFTKYILRDLYCNNFKFLSQTNSFYPFFIVLMRFPHLMQKNNDEYDKDYVSFSKHYLLKLLLKPQNGNVFRDLSIKIFKEVNNGFSLLESNVYTSLDEENLYKELCATRSVNNHYVMMLYWLLRKNNAKDFSYKLLGSNKFLQKEEIVIGDDNYDFEKQHIIPCSWLYKTYKINNRPSSSEINNIGNLTYITSQLNGFNGFSNKLFKDYKVYIKDEVFDDLVLNIDKIKENLRKHFIDNELSIKLNNLENNFKDIDKKDFQKYIEYRRKLIFYTFLSWISELQTYNISKIENLIACSFESQDYILNNKKWQKNLLLKLNSDVSFTTFSKWKINKRNKSYLWISPVENNNFIFFDLDISNNGVFKIQFSNFANSKYQVSKELKRKIEYNGYLDYLEDKEINTNNHVLLRKVYPLLPTNNKDNVHEYIYSCLCKDWVPILPLLFDLMNESLDIYKRLKNP